MPPLSHENRFIIDFKEKAKLFNNFFSNNVTNISKLIIANNSKLPTSPSYLTDKRLSTIIFQPKI